MSFQTPSLKALRIMAIKMTTKKFRANHEDEAIIIKARELLGMSNDSAVIRVLNKLGLQRLEKLHKRVSNVAQSLKYSEIDYLTSSMNVRLKKQKQQENNQK